MRVVSCSAFGSLDQLTVDERPAPRCGEREVRIAVAAAGVNFVDGLIVQGLYQIKPPVPFTPGNEVAGRVSEVGAAVSGFVVGDRVFANVGFGGFASEVVIDARRVMHTPAALTDGQAATFTQSYMTAWFALRHRARAQAGQWLLVLGAGGGVGLAAVDVATAMGVHVIAAASSADKRAIATASGAVATVDTSHDDLKLRTRELLATLSGDAPVDGVDLVYDPVGGSLAEEALRTLRDDGQFLVIGFASGAIPQLPANHVLLRNRRVTGVDWGGWVARHQVENAAMLADVVASIERGELHPVEPVAYPFDEAARALDDQLQRRVVGKTVLTP
jgi:NADPH2:quinone reductase